MSHSRRIGGVVVAGFLLGALLPSPAAAHAIGGTFQLPVPLFLYLAGAAVAVAASFVVTVVVARRASPATYRLRPAASAQA